MVANFAFTVENEHFIQVLVLLNKTFRYISQTGLGTKVK